MKKQRRIDTAIGILLLVALVTIYVFVHPVVLISPDGVRSTFLLGSYTRLERAEEMSGGYKCYVNDSEYFWLSSGDCQAAEGAPAIRYQFSDTTILYRGES